jgi:DNA-binding response OmpR family regulator
VVDTDTSIREMLSMALTDEGYLVAAAETLEEGIALVSTFNPDIVLFDLYRLKACVFIQKCIQNKPTPVAFIGLSTAFDVQEQVSPLLNDVLIKPFDLDDLLTIVQNNLLALRQ